MLTNPVIPEMAFTSAKMALRIWNQLTDLYDNSKLADNWAKVDYHDHSPGKGVQIPTEGIADAAVTPAKLAASVDPGGAYTSLKPIMRFQGTTASAQAAGTYVLRNDTNTLSAVPTQAMASAVYLDPADWAASGRTATYTLVGYLVTNAVAPTATYAFALQPISSWGGTAGNAPTIATLGAATITTGNIVAPAAGAPATPVAVDVIAPIAGWYTVTLVQTGAAAASSIAMVKATLFAKQV